jgi:nucleoside-diphosphate-sugar epimerase
MTRVLVTGAGGFIGQELCRVLEDRAFEVLPILRDKNVGPDTEWAAELEGVEVVIHLVAKTHEIRGNRVNDLALFRSVNVEGTVRLARQAAESGVKRLVFLSSIKVNGERTGETPFTAERTPMPEDSYGQSKLEAETALREIEQETGMEVVIIRPPLVYGPQVKGNLRGLINLVEKGIPLPLAAVKNRRSLVSIYNLCDLIRVCVSHPAAAGNTFLVADADPVSTADLVRYIADGLKRKAYIFPLPFWVLKMGARLVGKTKDVEKLTGNLQIDMSRTEEILQWHPPLTVAESFRKNFGG